MKINYKNGLITWKKKAVERRLENKELKKRIEELKTSRDRWKEKAQTARMVSEQVQTENEKIKKQVKKFLN